jgi:hypothetical protein
MDDNTDLNNSSKNWIAQMADQAEAPVRDELWLSIEAQVKKRKKRRIFIWWFLGSGLGATLTIGIVFSQMLTLTILKNTNTPPILPMQKQPVDCRPDTVVIASNYSTGSTSISLAPRTSSAIGRTAAPAPVRHIIPPTFVQALTATNIFSEEITASTILASDTTSSVESTEVFPLTAYLPMQALLFGFKDIKSLDSKKILIPLEANTPTNKLIIKQKRWLYSVGMAYTHSVLLIQPDLTDQVQIDPLPNKHTQHTGRSPGAQICFGIERPIQTHWHWRGQIKGHYEQQAADFALKQLDKPIITQQLLNDDELLVEITYADTAIQLRRQFTALTLGTDIGWYPINNKAHHIYAGGGIRWQDNRSGRRWNPSIQLGTQINLWRGVTLMLETEWLYNPAYWDYFTHQTLQFSSGLRVTW